MDFRLFPESASTSAPQVDAVFLALIIFSTVFVLLIFGAIIFFAIRYRKGSKANRENPVTSNPIIEWSWIIGPGAVIIALFFWSSMIFFRVTSPPEDSLDVYVVAKQWMWKVQHPAGQREINELHVPVDRPVRLYMTSQDVIHSFFVPSFRMKQDVVPGRYVSSWFEATKTGEFDLFCAEYCGTDHSRMRGKITVMEESEYQDWLDRTRDQVTPMAARGAALFQQLGCAGCHVTQTKEPAPKLDGLYDRLVTLENGKSILADEQYIRDSILLPTKHVVAGFNSVMPSYQGQVTEQELFDLVEYIKSLDEGKTPPP